MDPTLDSAVEACFVLREDGDPSERDLDAQFPRLPQESRASQALRKAAHDQMQDALSASMAAVANRASADVVEQLAGFIAQSVALVPRTATGEAPPLPQAASVLLGDEGPPLPTAVLHLGAWAMLPPACSAQRGMGRAGHRALTHTVPPQA